MSVVARTFKLRHALAIIPAVIFWIASMAFFVLGFSFDDQTGAMWWIALGLSIANTVIQIMGNDSTYDEMGLILTIGWIASYILGIASNVVSLLFVLNLPQYFEYAIAGSLGTMIEILPERMFVIAWRSIHPKLGSLTRRRTDNRSTRSSDQPRSSVVPRAIPQGSRWDFLRNSSLPPHIKSQLVEIGMTKGLQAARTAHDNVVNTQRAASS